MPILTKTFGSPPLTRIKASISTADATRPRAGTIDANRGTLRPDSRRSGGSWAARAAVVFRHARPQPVRFRGTVLTGTWWHEVTGTSWHLAARGLGRAPSTISREITRNGGRRRYRAWRAEAG